MASGPTFFLLRRGKLWPRYSFIQFLICCLLLQLTHIRSGLIYARSRGCKGESVHRGAGSTDGKAGSGAGVQATTLISPGAPLLHGASISSSVKWEIIIEPTSTAVARMRGGNAGVLITIATKRITAKFHMDRLRSPAL